MKIGKLFVVILAFFMFVGCGADGDSTNSETTIPDAANAGTNNGSSTDAAESLNSEETSTTPTVQDLSEAVAEETKADDPSPVATEVEEIEVTEETPAAPIIDFPLTALPGVDHHIALIYGDIFSSDRHIYLIDISNGTATQITNQPDAYSELRFSPDGNNIAFLVNSDTNLSSLYIGKSDGSDPIKIADLENLWDYQWSPDNNYLAAIVYRGQNQPKEVLLIDAKEGSQMVLAQNNDLYAELTWSPDSSVIYVSTGTLDSQIYAVSIVDGNMVPATDDVSLKGGSDWSPDGQYFAYKSGSGTSNLVVSGDNLEVELKLYVLPDDGDVLAWNPDVPNNKKQLAWIQEFAWSPDGTRIALKWRHSSTFEENLCVIEFADPSNRQCLFTLEGSGMDDIQWSPDGLYISFSATLGPNTGTTGLFIVDTVSGEIFILTEGALPIMFTDVTWID